MENRKIEKKIYYLNNRDVIILNTRSWAKKNPEKVKKSYNDWYAKNKHKKYLSNKNNPNTKINWKKWYLKNKDKKIKDAKERRINNPNLIIKSRLRSCFRCALCRYLKINRLSAKSKKYGINYQLIIEHLKPFPKDISKYHVDHIKPLCSFNFTIPEQIRIAFSPENHQWLLAEENLRKSGKILYNNTKEVY